MPTSEEQFRKVANLVAVLLSDLDRKLCEEGYSGELRDRILTATAPVATEMVMKGIFK